MKKKIKILMSMVAVFLLAGQIVSAASVSFTNFSYTTTPLDEAWQQVVAKTKADNEQNWYVTLTGSYGFDAIKPRAYFTSNTENNYWEAISNSVPILYSTSSIVEEYFVYTPAGSDCKLFIHGDENNFYAYTVNVSGRYTS